MGLDGSGDQTTQTPFTVQSVINMLTQLGVSLPAGTSLQLKNVAAVMVTSALPAFARPGQTIDVTVSSMGNAKSLRGGTLLMTPLKGGDGQIYAVAQGNILVGGVGASSASGGTSVQVNHLSVGRISAGATVERSVPTELGQGGHINLELNITDFSTTRRIVDAINGRFAPGTAEAVDGRLIQVRAPALADERVTFLSQIESLEVTPAQTGAKVVVNARTGPVVMNQTGMGGAFAVGHGNLTCRQQRTGDQPAVAVLDPGTDGAGRAHADRNRSDKGGLTMVKQSASLGEVVKALNAIGATPQDLLAILQAMKAAARCAPVKSSDRQAACPRAQQTERKEQSHHDSDQRH